jgi:hypothetical protein
MKKSLNENHIFDYRRPERDALPHAVRTQYRENRHALHLGNFLDLDSRFFSRFLFIWIVFLGAAVLVGKNEHMLMDFFLGKMKPAHRRAMEIIIQIGQIPLLGVMLMSGIKITRIRMRIPFDTWIFPRAGRTWRCPRARCS